MGRDRIQLQCELQWLSSDGAGCSGFRVTGRVAVDPPQTNSPLPSPAQPNLAQPNPANSTQPNPAHSIQAQPAHSAHHSSIPSAYPAHVLSPSHSIPPSGNDPALYPGKRTSLRVSDVKITGFPLPSMWMAMRWSSSRNCKDRGGGAWQDVFVADLTTAVRGSGHTSGHTHCSLFTTHCSLLTAHRSLYTAHCSLLTPQCSVLAAHCSLLTALLTAHSTLPSAHFTLHTAHCPWHQIKDGFELSERECNWQLAPPERRQIEFVAVEVLYKHVESGDQQ